MARLRTAYVIGLGWGGQAGSDITEVKISKKEYDEICNTPRGIVKTFRGREIYTIVDDYVSALYITQN